MNLRWLVTIQSKECWGTQSHWEWGMKRHQSQKPWVQYGPANTLAQDRGILLGETTFVAISDSGSSSCAKGVKEKIKWKHPPLPG